MLSSAEITTPCEASVAPPRSPSKAAEPDTSSCARSQPRLRVALHLSALQAIRIDPKFRDLYLRARARGQTVGRAIRNIVDRLLFLAVQLLKKNQLYDISLRQMAPEVVAAS